MCSDLARSGQISPQRTKHSTKGFGISDLSLKRPPQPGVNLKTLTYAFWRPEGAAYLDRGLRGGNYSVGGALAATLLGAAIGSAADRRPQSRFQFRYTVRQGDGEMRYVDEYTATPFRHSPGLCVRASVSGSDGV